MSAKTYYVGNANIIRRLDDIDIIGQPPGHNWIDIPLPAGLFTGGSSPLLKDIKTDPTNANKAFVVGYGYTIYKGVAFTTNAGSTWVTPSGNYQAAVLTADPFVWSEVWPIDTNNIVICGSSGWVAASTDGGATFNTLTRIVVSGLSQADCTAIHFTNINSGVVGLQDYIVRTINGGSSWSVLNGGNPLGAGVIKGIYLSQDQKVIVAVGTRLIVRSTNGGASFSTVYTFSGTGQHLTWDSTSFPIGTFWATGSGSELVKSTNEGAAWSTITPYVSTNGNYYAAHFYNPTTGFIGSTKTGLNSIYYSFNNVLSTSENCPPVVKSVEAIWTHIVPPVCYRVTECTTGAFYTVSTDLSAYVGQSIRFSIINGSSENQSVAGCWSVQISDSCLNSIEIQVDNVYNTCADCASRCYILTNCSNPADYIITTTNMESYLYKVIKLDSCSDRCYYVSRSSICDSSILIGNFIVYNDCTTCLGVKEPDPIYLNPRRIKPGYYTPACPPAFVENVNKNFASQVFDEMAIKRYGITICCDHDLQKWTIKKRILDLKSLYDPTLCVNCKLPCDSPCNITAEINIFTPTIICPAPSDVDANLVIPPDSCPGPETQVNVSIGYL